MEEMLERFALCEYERGITKRDFISDKVKHSYDRLEPDDNFIVFDFGDVLAKQKKWNELLPRVQPFYAVKCRPYLPVVKVLAALGLGFDCASKTEMESILSLGVDPSRIVYSHTRKQVSSLAFASRHGIDLMTFDDANELQKIKRNFPKARLLLRFAMYDETAQYPMGIKFGCKREKNLGLFQLAKELQLSVVGIHFHIGTGSKTPSNFCRAIAYSRELFHTAKDVGFELSILDIGGGFPGLDLSTGTFQKFAEAVNAGLDEHFPEDSQVKVIAEPGTYYMESAGTVVANVIGKHRRIVEDTKAPIPTAQTGANKVNSSGTANIQYDYYLNESLYTSLLDLLYEPPTSPKILKNMPKHTNYTGSIYGNSNCETDVIMRNCSLPELNEGAWVFFEDKGDYSYMVTHFNGFGRPFCYYAIPDYCSTILRRIIEDKEAVTETKTGDIGVLIADSIFQLQRDS